MKPSIKKFADFPDTLIGLLFSWSSGVFVLLVKKTTIRKSNYQIHIALHNILLGICTGSL